MSKNKKHFTLKTILTLGIAITDLLMKLHDKGYIHCDLKPDNVMIGDYRQNLTEMNQIYLIDFGISMRYLDS